ncbi:MAG: galactonate dehydratase [Oscillospiraceae bacterium]|nr:galactonate dehydratase [Oscillospiraceae bacterium]
MKIIDLKMIHIRPRWMFLKIETDEGIVGWGEPVVEGRSRTVETAVNEFRSILIGQDPLKIQHLWQLMYRGTFYRGGPVLCSAISGIEMALWDIKGKYFNIPVYQMLGGKCRDSIRMYGHLKPAGHASDFPIEDMLSLADVRLSEGFDVVKYSVIPPVLPIDNMLMCEGIIERFLKIRDHVGKAVDIAVDFHGRLSPAMSIRVLRELEPYYPLFVEEPVLPENVDEMVRVSRSTSIPIAAGERLFTKFGFRELIEKSAVSVVQPDLCHCGGIFEARTIAAMAETYYMQVAPHNPLGPISLAACIQLDATIPNLLAQEHPGMLNHQDLGVGILKTPFEIKEGRIRIPDGPGLGIEVDEEGLTELEYDGKWDTPHLFYQDGSVADW